MTIFTVANEFVDWLNSELADRNWSQAELSRRAEISQSAISLVLSGQRSPGMDFMEGLARAFRYPIELVLQHAGVIPERDQPPTLLEMIEIFRNSTPEEQEEMISFARWRVQRAKEERERAKKRRPGTEGA